MIKITKIKSKLMIAFFSIALLVVIVGVVGIVNSLHVYTSLNFVANKSLPELLVSNKIQTSINKIASDIVGFAVVNPLTNQLHQERLQQMMQDSKVLTALVDKLGKIDLDSDGNAESYPILNHLTSEYSTVSLQLINSKYNRMDEQSILNLISSEDNLRNKIDEMINERINMENTEIENEITKANESILTQQQEIIIASIAACVASLVIGRYISLNSIIKPLSKLKQATIQIAHDDFDLVEIKSIAKGDEIGELSMQFDNMRQTLDQRTRGLESSNRQLSLANEQLKVHDKMQWDFINIAAHELRTPIEPLLLGSEQLKHMLPNEEIVSIVLRNAKKLQVLANATLDATRIDSNTFKLHKERVNIKDIILDALQVTNGTSYNKDDGTKIIYEPEDIFIEADKDRMTQVVSNLLNNAMKSITKEKEQRVISVITERREDSEVVVSINDAGQGIDPEILPRLFTKFATKSFDGTGLGFLSLKALLKRMVERYGLRMINMVKAQHLHLVYHYYPNIKVHEFYIIYHTIPSRDNKNETLNYLLLV
jgi:signal transduction histidine kinase